MTTEDTITAMARQLQEKQLDIDGLKKRIVFLMQTVEHHRTTNYSHELDDAKNTNSVLYKLVQRLELETSNANTQAAVAQEDARLSKMEAKGYWAQLVVYGIKPKLPSHDYMKNKAMKALIGQVMRETKGRADAGEVMALIDVTIE